MELIISSAAEPVDSEDQEAIRKLDAEISRLYIRHRILAGLSGARIYIADIDFISTEWPSGPYIIKIQNADATRKEQRGYENAASSRQFRNLMPRLVGAPTRLNKSRCVMLFAVAKGTLAEAATVDYLLKQDVLQVIPQLRLLMKALQPDTRPSSPGRGVPRKAFQDILGTLLIGGSSITARALSKLGVGTQAARLTFVGDTDILPNPIAYLENDVLRGDQAEILWPVGPTHGDLNCQNIICALAQQNKQTVPDLIDYSNFRADGYILYDLAYLEFDLLMRILPLKTAEARSQFYRLCQDLTDSIKLPKTLSGGAYVIEVRKLLEPIRNYVQDYWIEKAGRPDDYYIAYWLACTAAGLNYMRKVTDVAGAKIALNYAA